MIHRFWLFSFLFDKKQKLRYLITATILLFIFSAITNMSQKLMLKVELYSSGQGVENFKKIQVAENAINFWSDLGTNILCVIFISSIYLITRSFEQEKRDVETQSLIRQLEINQLREQLNPHFMFNTLNNLYGVSLEQPQRTPDLILKLSQMMRYQIEANRKEYVSLQEEIEFIESYITIENERVSNRCTVYFEKNVVENDLKIAPILLLPFIENAFKHGTYSTEKSFITINISLHQDPKLKFETNSFLQKQEAPTFLSLKIENAVPQKIKNIHSTGIGLENVKQRLLRLYHQKYNLAINQSTTTFSVQLELKLHS